MVKLYRLGSKEQTTLEFASVEKAEIFLTHAYDHVFNPVKYYNDLVYRCKVTAISQYKLFDWVLEDCTGVGSDK